MTSGAEVPGIDRVALVGWLRATTDADVAHLRISQLAGGKSNLTYLLEDGVHRWVLRRPPLGPLTPTAHDMLREHRVVRALGPSRVPVPAAIGACEDDSVLGVPFAVFEHVAGRTVRSADDARALPEAARARALGSFVDTLVALHAVDPVAVGLGDLGRPAGFTARQVARWRGQWDRVATRDGSAALRLADRLAASVPDHDGAAIVHGDYRIDNVLLSDAGDVVAVLDWEMATLGDPLADLGLALVYLDPVSEPVLGVEHVSRAGLPGGDDLAERYAAASGRDLADLDFHLALACFKLAVIAEGIHERHLAGRTVGEGFETIGSAVEPLLAAGMERIG
ncbi:phosphotransferase family protein [Agromyces sp. MMS24-JH15]|uniref:phosphotransferase family protein n=1 Tax=Agromyces sp. MMS24-JH15 TaxID=3243765 RepID=UPI00374825AE